MMDLIFGYSIFDDVGYYIKKITKTAFLVLIVVGVVLIVIGCGRIMFNTNVGLFDVIESDAITASTSRYSWDKTAFAIKEQIIFGFTCLVYSVWCVPLYGFGELIESVKEIAENTKKEK